MYKFGLSTCNIILAGLLYIGGLSAQSHARMIAEKITMETAPDFVQAGPDAIGGIDDWIISNGSLCGVIAAVAHEGDLSVKGGTLRDLGFCARADDYIVSFQDLLDGEQAMPVNIEQVRAEKGDDYAAIITTGIYEGVVVETRYVMRKDRPDTLFISKAIERSHEDAVDFSRYASLLLNPASMESFVMSRQDPALTNGFSHKSFRHGGLSALGEAARNADMMIMLSPPDAPVPISYGWQLTNAYKMKDGEKIDLSRFILLDKSIGLFLVPSAPFIIGDGEKLGLLQLLQFPFLGLDVGEVLHIEEEIAVARGGDVAAITDKVFADAAMLKGRIKGEGAVVHIAREIITDDAVDFVPFSHINVGETGAFSLHAPAGRYRVDVRMPGGHTQTRMVTLNEMGGDAGLFDFTPPTRIYLPRGHAMRLVFQAQGETPRPDFEDRLTGYKVDGDSFGHSYAVSDVPLAGIESDPLFVDIAAGHYRVYATRGPEYSVEQAEIIIAAGESVTLDITPPMRVVESPGFMAADLHTHSGVSFDNNFSPVKRLRAFIAEHGEVMVASEHDVIFDFNPLMRQMGVQDKMISIAGTEMTSVIATEKLPYTIGHANFFPLIMEDYTFRKGAPAHENKRMREVLHAFRTQAPQSISQLNHARERLYISPAGELPDDYEALIEDAAYLDHMGPAAYPFNPQRPITEYPNNVLIEKDPVTGIRDIDFDAMEIMNGKRTKTMRALQRDWFSLLRQGIRLSGTANSDSHHLGQHVALPRNMVAMQRDNIADFDMERFSDSVRRGALYGTTGPLLDFTLSGVTMGDMYQGKQAVLSGRVLSADWVNADMLHIQINGETVQSIALSPQGQFSVPLIFNRDCFVTLEVTGAGGAIYQAIYPGFAPFAFSNPIYVDADKDGIWTPPGLAQATPIQ